jgi:hypothetical protein
LLAERETHLHPEQSLQGQTMTTGLIVSKQRKKARHISALPANEVNDDKNKGR